MNDMLVVIPVILGVLGAITYLWIDKKFNSLNGELKRYTDYKIGQIPNQHIYTSAVIDLYRKVLVPIDKYVEGDPMTHLYGLPVSFKTINLYSIGDLFLDASNELYKVISVENISNEGDKGMWVTYVVEHL